MKQTRQATDEKSNNSDKRSGIDSNEFNFNHLICRFFFFFARSFIAVTVLNYYIGFVIEYKNGCYAFLFITPTTPFT